MEGATPDPKLELLKRVPLFASLEPDHLAAVAAITDERDVPAGTTLTVEGRHEGYFYAIVDGDVRIDRGGQTINTLRAGDFLGEIALLDGGPRTATAVAETPSRLLVLNNRRFWELLDQEPGVREAVIQEFGRRLRAMDGESLH
ncbi:MAG TPA: cyclic nucleotide-binding domain-containing protein [Candidatus Limnocylindria bacterium]